MNTNQFRKQVSDLTDADFSLSAVWEFALDEEGEEGQDEATVRPYAVSGALDPTTGMFVVRARFALADGTVMRGYLTPPVQGDSTLATVQPIIVTPAGQVIFWCGMIVPTAQQISESYLRLRKSSASEVFPIRFESAVQLRDTQIRGEIPGFMILEDFKTMRTRTIT
jgi:hypothetical protein